MHARRPLIHALALLALPFAAAACADDNRAPALGLLSDQQVIVGEQLTLTLVASDPDGDRVTFAASGLPPDATIAQRGVAEAVLSYSPLITDTQPGGRRYDVTVEASDGRGGVARQTFGLLVFPAFGVPTFGLPQGVVLNLAQDDALSLLVQVKDDDSTRVDITLDEAPEGARMQEAGPKEALFYWRPDDAQRQVTVHRAVFTARDESHAPVEHVLTLVLLNGEPQSGCPGNPPTVVHAPPADQALNGAFEVSLDARDRESQVQSAVVHWTRGDPRGAYTATLLERPGGAGATWVGEVDVGAAPAGGALVHYYLTATDNDDPRGVACDQTARVPKVGWFTAAVYPFGRGDVTCVDDVAEPDGGLGLAPTLGPGVWPGRRLCGADVDVARIALPQAAAVTASVRWEPAHGAPSLRLLDASGAPIATAAVVGHGELAAAVPAGDAGELYVEVGASASLTRLSYALEITVDPVACANDAFEPNDAPAAATPLPAGVHPDLVLCRGDRDVFRVGAVAGEPLRLSAAFDHRYGDLDLELLAGDGATLLEAAATEKSVEVIEHTPQASGDLYLRVRGVDGARNAYTLSIVAPEGGPATCPVDALGDNRTSDAAIVLFSGVYEGFIVCDGAPDWFAVDVNGGETLDVLAETDAAGEPTIAVYEDPQGAPVAESVVEAGYVAVSWARGDAGRLYYRVSTGVERADYALLQEITDPPGACEPDRFEPNGAGQAAPLDDGVTTWLRLCGPDDVDAFALTVAPFTLITAITGHAPNVGFTDLRLLGPDGTELSAAIDPRDGAYLEVLAEQGGTYTLLVEPFEVAVGLGYDLAVFLD